jgi:hypothetical protein
MQTDAARCVEDGDAVQMARGQLFELHRPVEVCAQLVRDQQERYKATTLKRSLTPSACASATR